MVRKLMARILHVIGFDPRKSNMVIQGGRRSADRVGIDHQMATDRLTNQANRLLLIDKQVEARKGHE